jgi:hypothetical protein
MIAQWLRHCATSLKVSESIPGGVTLGIFSVATDGTMCPGIDSASKNEYQDILGGKDGRCVRMTTYHPCSGERQEIWGLNLPGIPVGLLGLSVGVIYKK